MSFDKEDIQTNTVTTSKADEVILGMLKEIFIDIKNRGYYEIETTGLYSKAMAVTFEDSIMSFGKFTGVSEVLSE